MKWKWMITFLMVLAMLFVGFDTASACNRVAPGVAFSYGYAYAPPVTYAPPAVSFAAVDPCACPAPVTFIPQPVTYAPTFFRFTPAYGYGGGFSFRGGGGRFHHGGGTQFSAGVGFNPRFEFVNRQGVIQPVKHFHLSGFPKIR